eukprot:TRINITY_DN345_c0_g2_i1.p1 TRINITY_DN345_c0_g2~~TRINITY_DN345_c0_g2_i1.p1  ORF type:complete len:265 (+),score=57.20 TRINITY_DN345_c0_g2_i1:360-1154(+)
MASIDRFYEFGRTIGEGSFSVVFEGRNKMTGKPYAIKKIAKNKISDLNKVKDREISIMMTVRHPYIICLEEVFEDEAHLYLVLQLAPSGELFDRIMREGPLSEYKAKSVAFQLLSALQYLKSNNIIHRDLKPENVLCMDEQVNRVAIADFGFARAIQDNQQVITQCGSLHYTAPEVLLSHPYGPEVDMWSLGVILFVVMTGCFPWIEDGDDNVQLVSQITNATFCFPEDVPLTLQCKDIISRMLQKNPLYRITPEAALGHSWFQ